MGFRAVLHLINKRWAYTVAGFFCITVIALIAGSCGSTWYQATGSGIYLEYRKNNSVPVEVPGVKYEINDYLFYLTLDLAGFSFTCHYDGDCENNFSDVQAPWDLSDYKATYGTIFAFLLVSMILMVPLFVLITVICWTQERIHPKITLVLYIVTIVMVVFIIVFEGIAWCVLFNHPVMARQSLGYSDSICPGGDSNDQQKGGFLCTWNGSYNYGEFNIVNYTFLNSPFRDLTTSWGPNTGWVLLTVSFGLTCAVFLLVAGWRPAFRS